MLDLKPIKAYIAEVERAGQRPHPDLVALVAEVEQLRQVLSDSAVADALVPALQRALHEAWELEGQCDMAFEQMATMRRIGDVRALAKKMRAKIKAQVGGDKA
jgi:hypothetical protein